MVAVSQPVSGDLGTERLPPRLPALRGLRDRRGMPKNWGSTEEASVMSQMSVAMAAAALLVMSIGSDAADQAAGARGGARGAAPAAAAARPAAAGPILVIDTAKGSIENQMV